MPRKTDHTKPWYVIARGVSNRPTTQHQATSPRASHTLCGRELEGWSRYWMRDELPVVACQRCKYIAGRR